MTTPARLFNSTAFRISALSLLVFSVFAMLVLTYVSWATRRALETQVTESVTSEIKSLQDQYRVGGIKRLQGAIERRARQPGAFLYHLVDAKGANIVGSSIDVNAEVFANHDWQELRISRYDEDQQVDAWVKARVSVLPNGFRMLVGRDLDEREDLRKIFSRAIMLSLLMMILLGGLGAIFIARRVLNRVDAMNATARNIMEGNLNQRLYVGGHDDEFDHLAENLNAMLDRISTLLSGLREVSDNIAHDLRTPLTRLRARSEAALRDAKTSEEFQNAMGKNIEEADGLIRIFDSLLMIARAESGTASVSHAPFDLSAALQDLAEFYEPMLEESGFSISTDIAPNLFVDGTRELLTQAIANLLENALKYGKGTDINHVQLSLQRDERELIIIVADHGEGIPVEERTRVLERFVRLEKSRNNAGSGLGLSLVSAIMRFHHGTLTLEDNAPGVCAKIRLPVYEPIVLEGGGHA